jgi:HSP20 family molecular chaperone IbpA
MTIEVALTVIKEESLHLAISDKKLIIRGERISTRHNSGSFAIRRERSSQFQQLIPLPESVSAGGFRAQLKGDIVQIEFAKLF